MNTEIVNGTGTSATHRAKARRGSLLGKIAPLAAAALASLFIAPAALASESDLIVPNLGDPKLSFLGMRGDHLLMIGLVVCALGLTFGMVIFTQLKNLPVHKRMLEISDLIYETCKTYLFTQGKFLALLWVFIGAIMVWYFGFLTVHTDPVTGVEHHGLSAMKVTVILLCSLVGIAGSYGVAWFGIASTPSPTAGRHSLRSRASLSPATTSRFARACPSAWCSSALNCW